MDPSDRRDRLASARLYLVTGPRDTEFLDAVLSAGVDVLQLRDKDAEPRDLIPPGELFREAAARHGALFIVNDRPDLALYLEADGVHLGQDDMDLDLAREIVGTRALIGLSTHSPEQLDGASEEADYVCVGPVWETPTKPGRPAVGLDPIRYAAEHERRPWFAIGGINESNVSEVVAAGARRIVVVRAITEASDPAAAARSLADAVRPT